MALGTLGAWLVVVEVMNADWSFDPVRVGVTAIGGVAATIVVALAVTWRALGARGGGAVARRVIWIKAGSLRFVHLSPSSIESPTRDPI